MAEQQARRTDLEEVIAQLRGAVNEFAKGNPEPAKALFSHRDDVMLANPFGPAVRGWDAVAAALDYAASRFSDGAVSGMERVVTYATDDLVVIHDIEHWKTRVGGGDLTPFDLRVTSTLRREDGAWKFVHRHADPISTANTQGPLRNTNA
jgi:ketosteroid isomerase-like protein